jgi:hypothetical protein
VGECHSPLASANVEIPQSPQPAGPVFVFLVERYLPTSAIGSLATSVANVARYCAALAGPTSVSYLQSIYVPAEDTCFCVFLARSADDVRAVNDAGRFPFDRIAEAVLLTTTP